MTREEREDTINFLKGYLDEEVYTEKCRKAHEMAIKALEQEPCDDCISRAYIEPIIEELENICVNGDEHILDLLADIKNAPPVIPNQKIGHWIDLDEKSAVCSCCYRNNTLYGDFCKWCGTKTKSLSADKDEPTIIENDSEG